MGRSSRAISFPPVHGRTRPRGSRKSHWIHRPARESDLVQIGSDWQRMRGPFAQHRPGDLAGIRVLGPSRDPNLLAEYQERWYLWTRTRASDFFGINGPGDRPK